MLVPDIEKIRSFISHSPFVHGFGIGVITLLIELMSIKYSIEYAPFAFLFGIFIGLEIKYRSNFSVRAGILSTVYLFLYITIIGFLLIAASCKFLGAANTTVKLSILFFLASAISSTFSFFFFIKNKKNTRETLSNCVDFKKHIIHKPANHKNSNISPLLICVIGVNIPLVFQILTGSRDNAVFIAPIAFLAFLYVNVKEIGPRLACFYLLLKYERKTGHRFVNADYEEIQELRRTFFLSRWLMKDYKPSNPRKTT